MNLLKFKPKRKYSIFLSNAYFSIIELNKNNCSFVLKQEKSSDSHTIIDDIKSNKLALRRLEPAYANVILDVGMGIVKVRSLPKTIKSKDIESALKISVETEMGHSINKYYFSYDLMFKGENSSTYILAYAEKEDMILVEKFFKNYALNIKSISHFAIDFLNALISLGLTIPMNVVYVTKEYYILFKLTEQFIDYKKVDLYDFDTRKEEILEDIRTNILILGLEDISLVYSSIFIKDHDFYNRLKNVVLTKNEITPPYDFDCYILNVNGGMY